MSKLKRIDKPNKPKINKQIIGKAFRVVGLGLIVTGFIVINVYNSNQIKSLKNNNTKLKNEMSLEIQVKKALEGKNIELNNKSLEYKKELSKIKKETEVKDNEIETLKKKLDSLKKDKGSQQAVSSRGELRQYGNWITMNASAYSTYANGDKLAGKQWGNLTAMGTNVRQGVIAVPRGSYKLGTKVELRFGSGWEHLSGFYTIEDTFGAGTTGNRIDVYMDSYNNCINFGRRDVQLRVIN